MAIQRIPREMHSLVIQLCKGDTYLYDQLKPLFLCFSVDEYNDTDYVWGDWFEFHGNECRYLGPDAEGCEPVFALRAWRKTNG